MEKKEFINYVKESYKNIFKNKYDEARANTSAENLLKVNGNDVEKAKAAADAIISRTKAKMEVSSKELKEFDSKTPIMKLKMGDHKVVVKSLDDVEIDGIKSDLKFKGSDKVSDVVDAIKKELKYDGVVKSFDAVGPTYKMPRWILKLGGKEITVNDNDEVFVDGKKQDWTVKMSDSLQSVLSTIVKNVLSNEVLLSDSLKEVKGMLFDAPSEVKSAFNTLINYFVK